MIGEGLGVDWATLRTLDERSDEARLAQAWTRDGVPARPAVIRAIQGPGSPLPMMRPVRQAPTPQ